MVKIKRKVEMTQEEYAKYLIDKYGVSGFESDLLYSNIIDAPKQYKITFELNPILKKELPNGSFRNGKFTVEVEEEITEDTKLDMLLDHFINPYGQHYVGNFYTNKSVNDILEANDELEVSTNSIHFFDIETKEFKLIWMFEKGLVE